MSLSKASIASGIRSSCTSRPNGVIAVPDESGGVTVYGSMQCPYYVHRALKVLLGLPDDKVRVVQTETGGGFGGKEEYPSMIAGHAALLRSRPAVPSSSSTTASRTCSRPPSATLRSCGIEPA